MPLVSTLILAAAACLQAQEIDLKAMKAQAAQGAAVPAQAVVLPPSVVIKGDNPPPPSRIDQIEHDMQYPALLGEDDDTAQAKNRAGLTEAHIKPRMQNTWATASGKAWLDKADIRFSLDQRMAITSDYSEASCPYRATREHETGHWTDNKSFLDEELAGLKLDLIGLGIPTRERPIAENETDAFDARIGGLIKAHQKAFTTRAKEAKAKRDDPQAYKDNDYSKCIPPKTKTNEWKTTGF